jgi:hypothetical protein
MHKALLAVLVVASLAAGCSNGGAQEAGPVPTVPETQPPTSSGTTSESTTNSASTGSSTPLCTDQTSTVSVVSQQGAAGTIRTVWRSKNTSAGSCRSRGYPGMDFRSAGQWLAVQVHRGGFGDINGSPSRVVIAPGKSLYFVSYWSDVDTATGPCREFDRVKVTLPDNFVSARVSATGCVDPDTVRVGPVTATKPSA